MSDEAVSISGLMEEAEGPVGTPSVSRSAPDSSPEGGATGSGFLDHFNDPGTRSYMERKGFKDVEALGASFASLERMVSNDSRRVVLPAGEEDAEGYERVFTALGRPASAEEYGFDQLMGADPEFAQRASEWLFEAGVGKGRAGALAEKWNAYVGEREAAAQAAFAAQSEADWEDLRGEWGPKFAEKTELFRRGALSFGLNRDEMAAIEMGLGTRRTAQLFSQIGQGLAEDRFIEGEGRGGFGMSREQAESRIAALRRDQAWQARWMSGGADEKAEWSRLTRIAGGER
ncbi:hypothetical protein GVN21_19045 [Caulobacter sp. SLTY]|uniref:hypothetical protein n=1 Tax=Caulobacter sp. SLTY TaxID=2683262 RepID=UPI001411FDE3|nr:hypothetical protein [Caulobacter sp. SLTY]NBB17462.1 hypothetical protein [Caulobacter sp. SLTY]